MSNQPAMPDVVTKQHPQAAGVHMGTQPHIMHTPFTQVAFHLPTPTATLSRVHISRDVSTCVRAMERGASAAIVRSLFRRVNTQELRDLPKEMDIRDICLKYPYPHVHYKLPPYILNTLLQLGTYHAQCTSTQIVRARIALVYGTPCPKWHVDKVQLRSLLSLYGPGVVLAQHKEQHISHVSAQTGDVVFMAGAAVDGSSHQTAALHRSPHRWSILPPRLMLQIDCWEM